MTDTTIFGTFDGTKLWAVGSNGLIFQSNDGEHWKPGRIGMKKGLEVSPGPNVKLPECAT